LPRFLGAVLVVVGIGCALRAWRARTAEDKTVALWERNALACAIALLAACFVFEPLGFVPTVALFLGFIFWRLGVLTAFFAPAILAPQGRDSGHVTISACRRIINLNSKIILDFQF
jgi:hypothetical protein